MVPIEDHVKKECDGIQEIMMIGDKRKYNVALITLKAVGANGEVPGTDALDAGASRVNPAVKTISAAMNDKVWIDEITAAITSANNNGKVCPNNAFKIQKFTILPSNFSEEGGELTPTKKLKRAVVSSKYAQTIDTIYESKETYVRYQ
jgi:long-chain-fatty-acid--CoA ligase ACSBG